MFTSVVIHASSSTCSLRNALCIMSPVGVRRDYGILDVQTAVENGEAINGLGDDGLIGENPKGFD